MFMFSSPGFHFCVGDVDVFYLIVWGLQQVDSWRMTYILGEILEIKNKKVTIEG